MSESDDRAWRYEVEEVGPDAEPEVRAIEPGSPEPENVAFFVLGVAVTVGVFALLVL